nr:glycosyl hydrolase 115 family protein [uncultured Clostridium sp.]
MTGRICIMTAGFILNQKTTIHSNYESEPVKRGIERFYRDMDMIFTPVQKGAETSAGKIMLQKTQLEAEKYYIRVKSCREIIIEAADDLGFIYALFHISERYLGIQPFWFWNDQRFVKKQEVVIPVSEFGSSSKCVDFRGWFINDEVLISHWDGGKNKEYPWEMAFEALLRCGGNVVIPGTDSNSKRYASLASDMGLWITHHHAEPLGAEMFLRAYPDKNPSFKEHPDLFRHLWKEGIERQKNKRIIWNLGFRGQGDTPFWEQDPFYDTPQKRGDLISSIIQEQIRLVKEYVEKPVFCTNLYGETMELYQQGFLNLPADVIMIWADNGYGKMVSRRQGNHNPRVPALPGENLKDQSHGVYYHVSFYDLQAANVLTMIPNSMEFVEKELKKAYCCGVKNMWLINCSNIKPHVYPLDFISSLWNGVMDSPDKHLDNYLNTYYLTENNLEDCRQPLRKEMKDCFQKYFHTMLPYGILEDEHAGEQFYNYVTRVLIHGFMKDGGTKPCKELNWCIPAEHFSAQMKWYQEKCKKAYPGFNELLESCIRIGGNAGMLWADSILLQVKIHTWCLSGVIHFTDAYDAFSEENYLKAFYELGQAADWFSAANQAMKSCCHDKWKGFYDNDCQTDMKETAYLLRQLMGYVRNVGDGPYFYQWQRLVIYPEKDRKILLLLNEENHMTDEELYIAMKEKHDFTEFSAY